MRPDVLRREAASMAPVMIADRRTFHRHPEVAWHEERTAVAVCNRLAAMDIPHQKGQVGHSVVAQIEGGRPGPILGWRADMDALPIPDGKDVEYASENEGICHACGHDAHMAMALGIARLFQRHRAELPGTLLVIFQPAEETIPSGAESLVRLPLLQRLEGCWAVHIDPALPAGRISMRRGPMNAAVDLFRIEVTGKTGHSARPHLSVDALLVAARILEGIHTLRSTLITPLRPAVINVGKMQGGYVANAIAGNATMEGAIRTFHADDRRALHEALHVMATSMAAAQGASAVVTIEHGSPALVNDSTMIDLAAAAVEECLGPEALHWMEEPSTGGEDFSHFQNLCPIAMVRVGTARPGAPIQHLHTPGFELDESALGPAVECMGLALWRQFELLAPKQ